ncbi:hypothetical protein V5O48_006278 [Marasmius crinis-equi]|uniref:F-box domain-containing protein n=1 Tax=Marasmius crinis-equi TaxID=585013 RepID=A0ABR3FJY4_9AGAR
MSRKSSRLQEKRNISTSVQPKDEVLPEATAVEPARKKARTSASRRSKKGGEDQGDSEKGTLRRIVNDMPLDVILEIFKFLELQDILHLSRTSRDLRRIIMARSSRSVWRAACVNSGCPTPSEHMSEPEFAALLFDPVCTFCHRSPSCGIIYWDLGMRLHDACVPKALYTFDELTQLKNWSADVETMVKRLRECGPDRVNSIPCYTDGRKLLKGRGRFQKAYLPSTIKRFRLEYMQVKDDPFRLAAWEGEKVKEHHSRLEFAKECQDWQNDRREAERIRTRALLNERCFAIKNKLTPSGWTNTHFADYAFVFHPKVHAVMPLTDQEWLEIEPIFAPLLEDIKASQLKTRRDTVYSARFSALDGFYRDHINDLMRATHQAFVPFPEFLLAPDAEPLIKLILDTSIEDALPKVAVQQLIPGNDSLVELSKKYFSQREQELQTCLEKKTRRSIDQVVFKCKNCYQSIFAPTLYSHACISSVYTKSKPDWKWPQYNPFKPRITCRLWSASRFEYDAPLTAFANKMFELCGATDIRSLNDIDPLLECFGCRKKGARTFYRWSRAINAHLHCKNFKLHTLSVSSYDEDMRRLVEDAEYHKVETLLMSDGIICKLCPPGASQSGRLHQHMKSQHKLSKAKKGVHWGWNISTPHPRLFWPPPIKVLNGVVV